MLYLQYATHFINKQNKKMRSFKVMHLILSAADVEAKMNGS